MKEVYLLRHAERGIEDAISDRGQLLSRKLGELLPKFSKVISSDSPRTIITASLITGDEPQIDKKASFYEPTEENSPAIKQQAVDNKITFFEAADMYESNILKDGIYNQAQGLNQLIDETFSDLDENSKALIVSHDMTISPAMVMRGQPSQSVDYLCGYIIKDDGTLRIFSPSV